MSYQGKIPPHRKDLRTRVNPEQCRAQRQRQTIFINKQARERLMSEKRKKYDESLQDEEQQRKYTEEEVMSALNTLKNSSGETLLENLVNVRKILCADEAPVSAMMRAGVVGVLFDVLSGGADDKCLLEAVWCATNLSAGKREDVVQLMPLVPVLVAHLSGKHDFLREQSLICLGNISMDGDDLRDSVRASGAVKSAVFALACGVEPVVKAAAFLLCNLVRGPDGKVGLLMDAGGAAAIVEALRETEEESTKAEVLWLLSYSTAPGERYVNAFLALCPLIGMLCAELRGAVEGERGAFLVVPILRVISNIIAGPDERTAEFLADERFRSDLMACMRAEHRAVKKESVWLVSNMASSDRRNVEVLVRTDGMVPILAHLLDRYGFDIKKEAAYALVNMSFACDLVVPLVQEGVLPGFTELLKSTDPEAVHMALAFVESVLERHPDGPDKVMEVDGIDALEQVAVSSHPHALCARASSMIDKYYSEVPDDEGPAQGEAMQSSPLAQRRIQF